MICAKKSRTKCRGANSNFDLAEIPSTYFSILSLTVLNLAEKLRKTKGVHGVACRALGAWLPSCSRLLRCGPPPDPRPLLAAAAADCRTDGGPNFLRAAGAPAGPFTPGLRRAAGRRP
jgi:hypothetical protein